MSIMDVNLSGTSSGNEATKATVNAKRKSIFVFIQEMKDELRKVSWTSKGELILSTKIVVFATFFMGFSIYLVDLGVKGLLEMIKATVHFIFG